MDDIIDYIKSFLLYGNDEAAEHIGYTADESMWHRYKLVIVPGRNLLTGTLREWTMPDLSTPAHAEKIGEFTDEFGETVGGTWVIREDIVYNTLYCLSLASELTMKDDSELDDEHRIRDIHGRIPSAQSALGSQELYTIPVVDEYSRLCTKLMEAPLPDSRFSRVVLTHDVDTIEHYRHLRGFVGGLMRGKAKAAFGALTGLDMDPAYTFPWMHETDRRISQAEEVYFIKAGEGKGYDYPQYDLMSGDTGKLLRYLQQIDATVGLHTSYEAATAIDQAESADNARDIITAECERLERALDLQTEMVSPKVASCRWHYLRVTSAACLQALADAGVTDDYSIGWADHIGFRMGTTRPVRWINPYTLRLTDLTLHPLSIMDCTLSNSNYMNIEDEEEAYYTCQQLIDKVRQHGGELVLLWHNSIFTPDTYHRQLYRELIDYIAQQAD